MILDTNALSALFAGDPALEEVLAGAGRQHLPTVVIGEYRYGLLRSRASRELGLLLEILTSESIVLPIDIATAKHYASLRDELRRQATPIPENDVWISALARQHRLAVVSRDGHFDRVAGLERRAW